MSKRMLIDAAHPEETRVVVVQDSRVEDFDFESAAKTQIRGNIYLAKVTRIEPSLQAAFVDYGGNRHGFLAFNEIHPDYYQIPVSDREALIQAEQEAERAAAAHENIADLADDQVPDEQDGIERDDADATDQAFEAAGDASEGSDNATSEENGSDVDASLETSDVAATPNGDEQAEDVGSSELDTDEDQTSEEPDQNLQTDANGSNGDDSAEDDEMSAAQLRRLRRQKLRSYKIQEVMKRRQIILVQVVKEERGNKGAALTTYLSLAGRYCVLMPNTGRGGGISRKITNQLDRRSLKKIVESLEVPDGMGLIIRTAGSKRTKAEIKRDYEYLLRLWENVRSLTLESIAPALVHEEGSLVKRAIRDLYSKEIDSVLVEGEESYREAKSFMRMLMPSHAKNVKRYKEDYSIFQKYNIEPQLDSMFNPQVQLKSGGYIVINPTEALVAIDVNSGRATRERSIERTALQTNLEAAEEVARQCRLRDMAGLIVIDFIDMEEHRNNRAVEKRLRDCLKSDRARVQTGRISNFGLLEFSRQRMRSGVLEGSTSQCSLCHGTGVIRSTESTSLRILRAVEEQGMSDKISGLTIRVPSTTALYLLNQKRLQLQDIEARCGINVIVDADTAMASTEFQITKTAGSPSDRDISDGAVSLETPLVSSNGAGYSDAGGDSQQGGEGKSKRRRRRRSRKGERTSAEDPPQNGSEPSEAAATENGESAETGDTREAQDGRRRRRRGRRGGRRHTKKKTEETAADDVMEDQGAPEEQSASDQQVEPANESVSVFDDKIITSAESVVEEMPNGGSESDNGQARREANPVEEPPFTEDAKPDVPPPHESQETQSALETPPDPPKEKPQQPRRGGWWQRRSP